MAMRMARTVRDIKPRPYRSNITLASDCGAKFDTCRKVLVGQAAVQFALPHIYLGM